MDDESVQQLKRRHRFDEWHGRNTLPEGLFIHNFFPLDGQLPGFRLERLQQVPADGDQAHYQSVWKATSGDPQRRVRLDVYSCPSRAAAHELVARLLAGFQSPAVQRDDQIGVGDVCFSGPGHAALVFARANLAMFVARIGGTPLQVADIARQFDAFLTERPLEPLTSPTPARRRAASKVKVGARRALPADAVPRTESRGVPRAESRGVQPEQPHSGRTFAKIFSTGGEVSLDRGRLVFSAERPGPAHVDAFVVGEGDPVAGRRTTLDVE